MKIVLLSLKGLGDTLMLIPLLRALHLAYPNARMTVLVPDKACVELLGGYPHVSAVMVDYRRPGLKLAWNTLKLLYFLRAERFDLAITTFPSNRAWYNLLARWTGAPKRVSNTYGHASWRTLSFLQNCRVAANPAHHEVEQNLGLLSALGLDPATADKDLSPWLSAEDDAFAKTFLVEHDLKNSGQIIGLHPAITPHQIYKAWASDNVKVFAELSDWLSEIGAKVIVFSGPDEKEATAGVLANAKVHPAVCTGATVNQTAALIKYCSFFINTDSGLGHLAAAVGTPVITVFGPANPTMTAPYGAANIVVRPATPCAPCYDYPYASTYPRLKCAAPACMEKIDLAAVKAAASKILKKQCRYA
jgi:ADP-heptose:LPS heptosyltransferase